MKSIQLKRGWYGLVLISLLVTLWNGTFSPLPAIASTVPPSDSPPPPTPPAPEIDPSGFQSNPFVLPVTPRPPLTLNTFIDPVAVAPGKLATVTLVFTATQKIPVLIDAMLPENLSVESTEKDWQVALKGRHLFTQSAPEPDRPVTLTLPLRIEGDLDTRSQIELSIQQGEHRLPATLEIWRTLPGTAHPGPDGGLLLFPDGNAWINFAGQPVETMAENTVTGTQRLQTPGFLPYSLERAYEIQGSSFKKASLTVVLPAAASPDLLELGTIFQYNPATDRWQKLLTHRTRQGETVLLTAPISQTGIYAAAISTSSDVGNYEQPWAPTITEAQVDLFTGGVSWNYPIDIPSGRTGQSPAVALSYHSGILDTLRGDLNPQASWAGLGWNLDVGYISRRIELDENFVPRYTRDFFLVLNGVSSKLIDLGGDQYRTADERFWRIERKSTNTNRGGDYWLVTTMDGTQYRFGYQDETAGGDSRESAWWMVGSRCDGTEALCTENWRWNLDQITDPRGNHIRFDYRVEHNNFRFYWEGERYYYSDYSPCGPGEDSCWNWPFYDHWVVQQGYIRGGSLEQITYSWPQAAYKIYFESEARTDYPINFDSQVTGIQPVQTFWIKERLKAIVILSNGQSDVTRRYELTRNPDDTRLLQSIQPVAADGSRQPKALFHYIGLAGYLEECRDGQAEGGWKPWLVGIENGYGGGITLNYTAPIELPWFQNGQIRTPQEDGRCWYRYRVREVTTIPGVGPNIRTVYEYRQAEGDAPHDGSWDGDEFRGHPRVRVRQRNADGSLGAYTDTWFLQGQAGAVQSVCDGELADRKGLEGRQYRQISYDAAGTALAQQTQRWNYVDLGGERHFVGLGAACSFPNGGTGPYARVDYAYDGYGHVVWERHHGDMSRSGDEVTLTYRYLYNESAWILTGLAETQIIAYDGVIELQSRTAYDNQPFGVPPTKGLPTWTAQGTDRWGWITATVGYDEWGNATTSTDPLDRLTRTTYDDRYHLYPTALTNVLGQTGRWSWDQRLNVLTAVSDANQAVKQVQHDAFGRLTALIPPGQNVPSVKYSYPTGDAVAAPFTVQMAARIDPYTTPDYRRSWIVYDGLGRVIQTQQEVENGWLLVQSTAYNALGQAVLSSLPYTVTATGGNYLPPAWNLLKQTRTEYDALGRPVKVTAPGNLVVQKAYRDWTELTLDANGRQKRNVQDGLGRLIEVHEYTGQYAAPDWNAAAALVILYEYDAQGRLIATQDAGGNVTRIHYDPLGRKTAMEDPSMGRWSYRYDAVGNLIAQTDAEGHQLHFTYDPLNRLIRKATAEGLTLATYEYDQGPNGIGRRTAMTDSLGTAHWIYDIEGRIVNGSRTLAGELFTTQLSYGAAGQVTSQVLPNGEILDWTYNRRGLPQQLHSRTYGQDYLRQAGYNALGQPLVQVWGNNLATTYTYAADTQRLQQLQVTGGLLDFRYSYDPNGNITAIQDMANGGQIQIFRYDSLDRLISAQTNNVGEGQYQESYQYDSMGNLINKTADGVSENYTYGQDLQPIQITPPATMTYRTYFPIAMKRCGGRLPCQATLTQPFAAVETSGGFKAVYDRNGNMTVRVAMENGRPVTYNLSYNLENQLEAVTNTTTLSTTRYFYDGDGARIQEIRQGSTILRLGDVEIERSAAGQTVRTYYQLGGQRIAMRERAQLTYLHGDQLGSSSLATGSDGSVLSRMRYRPFGESRGGTLPTDYGFTGQRDAGMGLYDYNSRFYDPELGRFIQADTIVPQPAEGQSWNRYSYVNNNPPNYVDPSGHCLLSDDYYKECSDLLNEANATFGIEIIDVTGAWTLNHISWLKFVLLTLKNKIGNEAFNRYLKGTKFDIQRTDTSINAYYENNKGDPFYGNIAFSLGFLPYASEASFKQVTFHELMHKLKDFAFFGKGANVLDDFANATHWKNDSGDYVNPQTGPTAYAREEISDKPPDIAAEEDMAESLAIYLLYSNPSDISRYILPAENKFIGLDSERQLWAPTFFNRIREVKTTHK